jgi:hypothetical protein
MTEKKRRTAKKRPGTPNQSPYFLQPAKQGTVTVFRRPAGNRIDPKLCGTMASRAMALALVKQLEKAESVVRDLFLEATDDGIEALEAVLEACRQSVVGRAGVGAAAGAGEARGKAPGTAGGGTGRSRRGRGRRGGPPLPPGASADERGESPSGAPNGSPTSSTEDTSAA